MNKPYSQAKAYIAQLKNIEQRIAQNELQEAARQLNQLARTEAHDPRLFLLGSRLAEMAGNPDGMLTAARRAQQLAPQWPPALIRLADVHASRGDVAEAIAMAGQAVQHARAGADPVDVGLLTLAAGIAQRFGQPAQALQWLRQAEQVKPQDASIRYKIGLTLTECGEPAQAIEVFDQLLEQQPNMAALLSARLQASLRAGQTAQAERDAQALLAQQPDNPVHQFYLEIARGNTPPAQPAALVAAVFDDYAVFFDRHSVIQSHYQLPRDVANLIHQWHPDRRGDVLDLGCGTGLLGVCLGAIEGVLVGVDVSGRMLAQAARHQVYDRFHQVNLLDALQATPGDLYHVITALDVFGFVGELASVIPNAWRILLPGGRFVFSCNTDAQDSADYTLHGNYRYTHQSGYVQRLLDQAGFAGVSLEQRVIRTEAGQPVNGFVVTACKVAS